MPHASRCAPPALQADHWTGSAAGVALVQRLLCCTAAPRWQLGEVQQLISRTERLVQLAEPWVPSSLAVAGVLEEMKQLVTDAVARAPAGQQAFPALAAFDATAST